MRMLSRSDVPRSVIALRFEMTLAAAGMPVGRSHGDAELGNRMLPRNRAAASKKRIEQAGFDVRDAEHERVVGGSHASIDIVAGSRCCGTFRTRGR